MLIDFSIIVIPFAPNVKLSIRERVNKMFLKNYLKSGYPLIWVTSDEIDRARKEIVGFLQKTPVEKTESGDIYYSIFKWDIASGVSEITPQGNIPKNQGQDAISSLQSILTLGDRNVVMIIENYHHYLKTPMVLQTLLNLRDTLKMSRRHIIFLSCQVELPLEIQKEIIILDFPLPDEEALATLSMEMLSLFKTETIAFELKTKVINLLKGLTLFEAENVLCLAFIENSNVFDEKCLKILIREKKQILRKSQILEYYESSTNLGCVGGLNNLKGWLQSREKAFLPEAKSFGLPAPKGILLVGIPGSGKSLLAKSIASSWALPLVRFDISRLFGSLVGQTEQNLRSALKTIDAIGECIVWIDEIEKGLSGSKSSGQTDSGVTSRVMGNLLTWMQEKTSPSFVVATANDVSQLPPELLRKGRWDECFFVDLPTSAEREKIFAIQLKKRNREPEKFSIAAFASKTEGYTGAEIEQIIIESLFWAFNEGRELSNEDILVSIPSVIPLSQTRSEQINSIREWARTRARSASITTSNFMPEKRLISN